MKPVAPDTRMRIVRSSDCRTPNAAMPDVDDDGSLVRRARMRFAVAARDGGSRAICESAGHGPHFAGNASVPGVKLRCKFRPSCSAPPVELRSVLGIYLEPCTPECAEAEAACAA